MIETTQLLIRASLLKRLERLSPPYLHGQRKHAARVEHALEAYIRQQREARQRKAG